MTEQKFGTINDIQKTDLVEIGQQALRKIDTNYGNGCGDGSGKNWLYHNGHHARMVGRGALRAGQAAGLTPDMLAIAEVAGYAHDFYQGSHHEQRSAEWLEEQLRQKGLPKGITAIASLAIRGTQPLFRDGVIVGQVAAQQSYSSKEAETVALSVASADLSSLYTPIGPLVGHDIYREFHGTISPAIDDGLINFQRNQVQMLEGYQFPLPQADKIFATHRPQVQRYGEQILEQLERGDIENWQQLRSRDEAFYRQHSR